MVYVLRSTILSVVAWPITRIKVPENILVFRGIEVSHSGHLLVYGVSDDSWNLWGRNNYPKLAKVVESVHSRGGICIPAHPFRGWESLGDQVFSFDHLDGIETHNGVNVPLQNKPAVEAALKLGLPSVGGSDCHYLHQVGRAFTEFDNPIRTMDDMIKEIKGRELPWEDPGGWVKAVSWQGEDADFHLVPRQGLCPGEMTGILPVIL